MHAELDVTILVRTAAYDTVHVTTNSWQHGVTPYYRIFHRYRRSVA